MEGWNSLSCDVYRSTRVSSLLQYSLYDAFSSQKYGGSQAAIVLNAKSLDQPTRVAIANELGYPATVYVSDISGNTISVQFYSTVAELPMCGHGTVALISCLADRELIDCSCGGSLDLTLLLPNGDTKVSALKTSDKHTLAMLEVKVADFRNDAINTESLCNALGLKPESFATHLPIETAVADFTHLIVPVRGIADVKLLQPSFADIVTFHKDYGIETITVVSTETSSTTAAVRIRDFCPAVGVAESAAAGTTNAAVAGYLFRHKLIEAGADDVIELIAEQGIEINRPSEIHSRLHISANRIETQWVGGVASKVASGNLE